MILNRVNSIKYRGMNMCDSTCNIGSQKIPAYCNVLFNSNIFNGNIYRRMTDVNKIISLLIFLMLS